MNIDGLVKGPRVVMPVPDQVRDDGSGIQYILRLLDSAKASLRARLPDQVRHKLRRNDLFGLLVLGIWVLFVIWCL